MNNFSQFQSLLEGTSYNVIVVGAGSSIKKHRTSIINYAKKINAITIGINVISHILIPDYQLWTNSLHFKKYGACISDKSKKIFGFYMKKNIIKCHYDGKYYILFYNRNQKTSSKFSLLNGGYINGECRTAGTLAIVLAHIMKAQKIYVVGMDGYTFYSRKQLKDESQHCYGRGKNDDASWEQCLKKDKEIYKWLEVIYDYGIIFNIITPTLYNKFYQEDLLT